MDESLLAARGVCINAVKIGYVENYALRIGARATLVPDAGSRAYGLVAEIDPVDVAALYAQESVSDYVAEQVVVQLDAENETTAQCYNLPAARLEGTNPEYAAALLALATELAFPDSYLKRIKRYSELA